MLGVAFGRSSPGDQVPILLEDALRLQTPRAMQCVQNQCEESPLPPLAAEK
jgi:hypothetical protein